MCCASLLAWFAAVPAACLFVCIRSGFEHSRHYLFCSVGDSKVTAQLPLAHSLDFCVWLGNFAHHIKHVDNAADYRNSVKCSLSLSSSELRVRSIRLLLLQPARLIEVQVGP